MWVLLWGDDVTVFQPNNVRQGVSDGSDRQLNQSALSYTDVLQLLNKLGSDQVFFRCEWQSQLNSLKHLKQTKLVGM